MSPAGSEAQAGLQGAALPPGRARGVVVGTMGLGQVLVWGSSYYLPAVLARPIAAQTGWPLPWVIGALSLALLVSGLVSPLVGELIERHGGRPVLMGGAVLMAVGLSILAVAPDLPVFVLGWLVLGGAMGAGLYDPAFATLGRLYGRQARAVITSLTLIAGFASTLCWPLSALLLHHFGWRGACLAYAGINLGVVLPLYRFGLPAEERRLPAPQAAMAAATGGTVTGATASGAPASEGAATGAATGEPATSGTTTDETATGAAATGAATGELGASARQAALFGLVALAMSLSSIIAAVMSVQLLAVLEQRGVPLDAAVALGAIIGPCQVGARLIDLLAGQRTHPVWESLISAVFVTLGLGLLLTRPGAVVPALVIYGGGMGLRSIVRGTLPLAMFGPAGYARLIGRLAFPMLLAQAAGPWAGAMLLADFGGGAVLAALFWIAVATLVCAVALLPFARRRAAPGATGPAAG